MTTPPIPHAMREAGARALYELDCALAETYGVTDPIAWDDMTEADRFVHYDNAVTVLAAALGVCEVREEWGVRYHDLHAEDGLPVEVTWWNPTANRRECEEFADSRPWGFHARVIRRLVITSPAEQVDTEGAPA